MKRINRLEAISNDEESKPLHLVLFLRTHTASNFLKSKSAVDRLARECVSEDSIHMLMIGKGIDATTVNLYFILWVALHYGLGLVTIPSIKELIPSMLSV